MQSPSSAGGDAWGAASTWTSYATGVPAEIKGTAAGQQLKAGGMASQTTYQVRIRYRGDVNNTHRIVWRDKTLQIEGVVDADGRRRELTITAYEHAS